VLLGAVTGLDADADQSRRAAGVGVQQEAELVNGLRDDLRRMDRDVDRAAGSFRRRDAEPKASVARRTRSFGVRRASGDSGHPGGEDDGGAGHPAASRP
jgi:hypothetical protein